MTTVFISVECTLFSHFTDVLFIYLFLSKIILTILTHCFREHCAELCVQVLSGFWLSSYVKTSEFTNWHKTLWNPCLHWERGRDGYVVQQAYDGNLLFTSLLYLYLIWGCSSWPSYRVCSHSTMRVMSWPTNLSPTNNSYSLTCRM